MWSPRHLLVKLSIFSNAVLKAINEKLDLSEQKLIEYASLPDIEEQLKDRMEALAAAQERQVLLLCCSELY